MGENVQIAFLLTILAGLSTGIGSLFAIFIKKGSTKWLAFTMGLAAGVMIYLSFMEMLPHATEALSEALDHGHHAHDHGHAHGHGYEHGHDHGHEEHNSGPWVALISFFGGILLVILIDRLTPNSHEPYDLENNSETQENKKLMRIGLMTAIALAIHNFPEGIATFVSALEDPYLGLTIAIAIAMHNIPEGISVAMPIYYATGDRKKAFMYSFLSGLVEPIGAFLCYFIFMDFINPIAMGVLIAGVAGIMVFISLDQLLPAANEYGDHRLSIYGAVVGMLLMATSLAMLGQHHAH